LRRFSDDPSVLEKTINDLYDPYLLRDMDRAIARLKQAKEKGEKVMIF
jgi:single-stranded-DNA-specific exonuclease